jgi:hypothetical protein
MDCDAIVKNENQTPIIYNHILFKDGGQEHLLSYGITISHYIQ